MTVGERGSASIGPHNSGIPGSGKAALKRAFGPENKMGPPIHFDWSGLPVRPSATRSTAWRSHLTAGFHEVFRSSLRRRPKLSPDKFLRSTPLPGGFSPSRFIRKAEPVSTLAGGPVALINRRRSSFLYRGVGAKSVGLDFFVDAACQSGQQQRDSPKLDRAELIKIRPEIADSEISIESSAGKQLDVAAGSCLHLCFVDSESHAVEFHRARTIARGVRQSTPENAQTELLHKTCVALCVMDCGDTGFCNLAGAWTC